MDCILNQVIVNCIACPVIDNCCCCSNELLNTQNKCDLVHVALWRVSDVTSMHSDSDVAVSDEAGADCAQSLQATRLLLLAPPNPSRAYSRHENFKVSESRDAQQIEVIWFNPTFWASK